MKRSPQGEEACGFIMLLRGCGSVTISKKHNLDKKFNDAWNKVDVNNHGFIDESEAYHFVRGLMGTFTSFIDGVDPKDLSLLSLDN